MPTTEKQRHAYRRNAPKPAIVTLHPIRNHILGPIKNDETNPIPPGPDDHIRLCGI